VIKLTGGDGSSREEAIIILNAEGEKEGVTAEYNYLEDILGKENIYWKFLYQHFIFEKTKIKS
jgi:hypothetical protein